MAFTVPTSGSTDLYLLQEGNLQNGTGSIWFYRSSDAAVTISGTTGYFAGQGQGSIGAAPIGMKIGDVVLAMESSNGATPGRVTFHGVISATANSTKGAYVSSTYGIDCSVQAAATT